MNEYERRQEERRKRYQQRAEKAQEAARSNAERSSRMLDVLPMGQPILIGHHSEKRHRALLRRSDKAMEKASEEYKKAEYYQGKAESVGRGGISQDDPDAIDKIKAQIEEAEALQARMVAANKALRRKGSTPESVAEASGLSVSVCAKLFEPDYCGRLGFAAFELQNNSANIRRMKARIDELQKKQERPEYKEIRGSGWLLYESKAENRIFLEFDDKPNKDACAALRSHGWRWSPRNRAWLHYINNRGLYSVREILKVAGLDPETVKE